MSRSLPLRANLEFLKKLAKERLEILRASDPVSTLSDAQFALAREFGFAKWQDLKDHVDRQSQQLDALVPPDVRQRAAAEVIAPDDPDVASFFAAIYAGEAQAVADALTRRPALVNTHDADGQTPLHAAAQYNDPNIAAVLVAYGANLRETFGQSAHTPLSWAVTCNAIDCARALVQLGAEPDIFCAAGIGSLGDVQAFFDPTGTLLPNVARTGSSRYDADGSRLPCPPPTPREQIADALYIAARNGHADVVRFLIGRGPDLSFRAYLGGTPLHWAYFSGSPVVIDLLLAAGADATAYDNALRCTPRAFGIATVANWGFDFLVKKLLAGDATLVNAVDPHTSPLHEAAQKGHVATVRLLLERGADPKFRNTAGQTPLDVAREHGHTQVVDILTQSAS